MPVGLWWRRGGGGCVRPGRALRLGLPSCGFVRVGTGNDRAYIGFRRGRNAGKGF